MSAESPDIFCVQETKCDIKSIPKEVEVPGYKHFWLSGDKDGYSGTGLYTKEEPINVSYGISKLLAVLLLTSLVNKVFRVAKCAMTSEYAIWYKLDCYCICLSCFVDNKKHDKEGRVITAEYEKFYFVTACKSSAAFFLTMLYTSIIVQF